MNILRFEPRHDPFRRRVSHAFQGALRAGLHRNAVRFTAKAVVDEMQEIVRLAGEAGGFVVKGQINLAARRLGLDYRECERLWYADRKSIPAELADWLRAKNADLLREKESRLENELAILRSKRSGVCPVAEAGR